MINLALLSVLVVSPIATLISPNLSHSTDIKSSIILDVTQSHSSPYLAQQEVPVVEEKGFAFEFLGCEVIAGASSPLVCDVLIENRQNTERKFAIHANTSRRSFSRVVDGNGNEILASIAQLGSSSSDRAAEVYLSPGVPIRASLSFEAPPERGIRVLDLGCYLYGNGGGSFDVEFLFGR